MEHRLCEVKKTAVAWLVCKFFALGGRDEGVQEERALKREVNDAVTYVHVNPCILRNKYFEEFVAVEIHPTQSCTSKGATETKSRTTYKYIRPRKNTKKECV